MSAITPSDSEEIIRKYAALKNRVPDWSGHDGTVWDCLALDLNSSVELTYDFAGQEDVLKILNAGEVPVMLSVVAYSPDSGRGAPHGWLSNTQRGAGIKEWEDIFPKVIAASDLESLKNQLTTEVEKCGDLGDMGIEFFAINLLTADIVYLRYFYPTDAAIHENCHAINGDGLHVLSEEGFGQFYVPFDEE